MKWKVAIAVIPVLFVLPAFAQEYRLDAWTADNGLPQNSVNRVLQTRDGFIWLATFAGLVRYDGDRFESSIPERSGSLTILAASAAGFTQRCSRVEGRKVHPIRLCGAHDQHGRESISLPYRFRRGVVLREGRAIRTCRCGDKHVLAARRSRALSAPASPALRECKPTPPELPEVLDFLSSDALLFLFIRHKVRGEFTPSARGDASAVLLIFIWAVLPNGSLDLIMPKAADEMIVDQAGSLHVRVTDGGTDERETTRLQFLAHGVGFRGAGRKSG